MVKDKTIEFNDEVNKLKVEEASLLLATAAFNTVHDIHENNLFRMKKLAYDYHIITKQREDEKEEKIKKLFETRIKLNFTLQKMIEAFDKTYRSEEKQKLEDEAELARKKRAQLNLEFDSRAKQIESLIRLQQSNYDQHCKLVVERDVAVVDIEKQQEKASQLYEENNVDKLKLKEFTEEVAESENQNTILRSELQIKRELLDQSKEIESVLNDLKKHRLKLISATVLSSQNLLDKSLNNASRSVNKVAEFLKYISGQNEDTELSIELENTSDYHSDNITNSIIHINENDYNEKDTELVWNSRREENYQIMSDSIRKFLRKKKRI